MNFKLTIQMARVLALAKGTITPKAGDNASWFYYAKKTITDLDAGYTRIYSDEVCVIVMEEDKLSLMVYLKATDDPAVIIASSGKLIRSSSEVLKLEQHLLKLVHSFTKELLEPA